jgi:hypothetical protein
MKLKIRVTSVRVLNSESENLLDEQILQNGSDLCESRIFVKCRITSYCYSTFYKNKYPADDLMLVRRKRLQLRPKNCVPKYVLCMYVCMYVCMHVCIYVYMYVCICVCIYMCVYICIYIYIHTHIPLRTDISAHEHVYTPPPPLPPPPLGGLQE